MAVIINQTLITGFFGKLPKFADFVKMNASGSEILILDNWIQAGLAAAKLKFNNDLKIYFEKSAPINFLFPFTDTDKIILGELKPARDKSGRQFPFLFFSILDKINFSNKAVHISVLNYQNLFLSINNAVQNNFESETLDELRTIVNEITTNSNFYNSFENDYEEFLNHNTIGNILRIQDMENDTNNQIDLNSLIKERLIFSENSSGISFIFSATQDEEYVTLSFVIEFLITTHSKQDILPAIFWKKISETDYVVFLFFQKPNSSDFVEMIYSEDFYQRTESNKQTSESFKILKNGSGNSSDGTLAELITSIKSSHQ